MQIEIPSAIGQLFKGKARYRVAYGGRGSAKSWGFARMLLVKALANPMRVLCARELQNSIKDSVIRLLADQIDSLKLPGFDIGDSFIRHQNGSEFIFKGLRTNASEIKSMEGIDICWVEEAQKVSNESWQILIPTIRKAGSEIWVTFNPGEESDATSQRFIVNQPHNAIIARVNYDQNPWFGGELQDEMEFLKRVDYDMYLHVWEGAFIDPLKGGLVCKTWSDANIDEIRYRDDLKIYLTCDFNVDPMSWGIAHRINGEYHFFDEICRENTNIISTAQVFANRYYKHESGIIITGDCSGRQRNDMSQNENQTRYDVLKKTLSDCGVKNFSVDINRSNPQISQRVEVWNSMVCDVNGVRRVKVDPKCKQIIRTMQSLKYRPGSDQIWQPTPKQIEDDPKMKFLRNDMFDAVSYLTWRYDPIVRPESGKLKEPPVIEFEV